MMLLIQLTTCHLGFSSLYLMNYNLCLHLTSNKYPAGLPRWLSGKESACPMRETRARSLKWEDPLEEEMAPCSSILA